MSERDYEVELRRLMNALAESVASATDEELLEDLTAQPASSERSGQNVKAMLLQTADEWATQRRHQAREVWVHRERESRMGTELGETSVKKIRHFLEGLFVETPELAAELTFAHRDFESWSDSDIRSLYRQALELGLVPDDHRGEEE